MAIHLKLTHVYLTANNLLVALVYVLCLSSRKFFVDSNAAQYNAWCRNNGDYYTAKRGSVNWNQELIWKMRSELEYQWDILEEEVPRVFDELLETLSTGLEDLKSHIKSTTSHCIFAQNCHS
jgi:hypothetical protein